MCQAISNNLLLVLQEAPKRIFSTNSRSSGQPKNDAKTLFSTLHPLSTVIFATATVLAFVLLYYSRFNFHCYTQREATPTQKSARKCAVTSHDILCKRLQSAFTLANQLRWIAQQVLSNGGLKKHFAWQQLHIQQHFATRQLVDLLKCQG